MKFAISSDIEIEIAVSFYTLYLYEQEFNSDLIKDVFGIMRISLEEEPAADQNEFVLDYTQQNWTALTKALWATAKTADDSVPKYSQWAKGIMNGLNMYKLSGEFREIVRTELFRLGVPADLS